MDYNKELDCVGYYCPVPIVKAKLELESMAIGEILKVHSDDVGSKSDFPAWCSETGNTLMGTDTEDGEYIFYIKKV